MGVPWLGLKRGLLEDTVISPYSTMLALMVNQVKAFENLRNEYQNNTGCFEQDDFGTLKEAFDTWFHVGDKGIYYVYFG